MKTIGLAAALVTTVLLAPANAHAAPAAPTKCGLNLLPEGDGWDMSIVTAADPTGRYVAGRGYPADEADFMRYPALWDAGRLRVVSVPGVDQAINDVNSSGVAVGDSFDVETGDFMAPWLIRGGEAVALPGGAAGSAIAINERGDIVGTLGGEVPVLWKMSSSSSYEWPQKLPVPDGAVRATVTGIDEDGTAVGSYDDTTGKSHAVVWSPDGEATTLPGLNRTASIRSGWITGVAFDTAPVWKRRDPRTGVATPYKQFGYMTAVNSAGSMVGQGQGDQGALLVTDAGDVILPGLTNGPYSTFAQDLSDDGRVVAGYAEDTTGELRAGWWECE